MKVCQYCGKPIEYSASRTRGAWYSGGGRTCPVATEEFKVAVEHRPEWDLEKRDWK